MAFDVKNDPQAIAYALVLSQNALILSGISTKFHLTQQQQSNNVDYRNPTVSLWTVTTADATTGEEALVLVNELKNYVDIHFTDAVAHDTATSAVITMADATDTATGVALANEIKAQINTHRTASNVHYTNDDTNTVTVADATDVTDLLAILVDIKEQINDHTQDAPTTLGYYINPVL